MAAPRILVIDPDARALAISAAGLRREGFEAITATTTAEAIAQLKTIPALVFCEARGQGIDGFAVCESARAEEATASVPFYLLARQDEPGHRARAKFAGADDYLVKPLFVRDLCTLAHLFAGKPAFEPELVGDLARTPLFFIVRALTSGGRSGTLEIPLESGAVHFRDGKIVEASTADLSGEAAISRLLLVSDGPFALHLGPVILRGSMSYSLRDLVIRDAPRRRRIERAISILGGPEAILAIDFAALARELPKLPASIETVVRLFDGVRSIADVLRQVGFDEVTAAEVVLRLRMLQVLRPASALKPAAPSEPPPLFEPRADDALQDMRTLFPEAEPVLAPGLPETAPAEVRDWATEFSGRDGLQEILAAGTGGWVAETAQEAGRRMTALGHAPSDAEIAVHLDALGDSSAGPQFAGMVALPGPASLAPPAPVEPGAPAPKAAVSAAPSTSYSSEPIALPAPAPKAPITAAPATSSSEPIALPAPAMTAGARPAPVQAPATRSMPVQPTVPPAPVRAPAVPVAQVAPAQPAPLPAPPVQVAPAQPAPTPVAPVQVAPVRPTAIEPAPIQAEEAQSAPVQSPDAAERSSETRTDSLPAPALAASDEDAFFSSEPEFAPPPRRSKTALVASIVGIALLAAGLAVLFWPAHSVPPAPPAPQPEPVAAVDSTPPPQPAVAAPSDAAVVAPVDDGLASLTGDADAGTPASADSTDGGIAPVAEAEAQDAGPAPLATVGADAAVGTVAIAAADAGAAPVAQAASDAGAAPVALAGADAGAVAPPSSPVAGNAGAAALLAEGRELFEKGKAEAALKPLAAAAELSPDDAEVHELIALASIDVGKSKQAEQAARRTLKLAPDNARAHLVLGTVYQERGRTVAARWEYIQYLKLDPRGKYAREVRAMLKELK